MISKFHIVFLALLVMAGCVAPLVLGAQNTHGLLRKGDERYDKSKYEASEKEYAEALKKEQNNNKAAYNLGNTYYRKGDYPSASRMFGEAARTAPTTAERADALHNLGNSFLKQEKYKEAVEAYQNSLLNRPGDAQTKQNLQMAKQKKQEQEQQEQEKEKQKQKQQQQNQQNKQNQQQNQQQQGQQNQQQQNQSQQQQQNQQQQNQQQNQQNQQQQPGNPQQQGDQQIPKLEQPSEQFLEAIGREDRKNKRKYQEKTNNAKPSTRRKDW